MQSTWIRVVCVYLALPHLIFYWGWMQLIPAGVFTALLLFALLALLWPERLPPFLAFKILRAEGGDIRPFEGWTSRSSLDDSHSVGEKPSVRALTCSLFLSLGFLLLSGVGGVGHFNTDLIVVHSMMRNLVEDPWPVSFFGGQRDLVYYLGLVLPASALGKLFPELTFQAHAAYVFVGLFLFSSSLIGFFNPPLHVQVDPASPEVPSRVWARVFVGISTVVLFGGFDAVGWLIRFHAWPEWGTHIEWWNQQYQWSSFLTQLVWVPRHAIPAWLGVMTICSFRSEKGAAGSAWRAALFVLPLLPFWSPFVALGLLPFALWSFWGKREEIRFSILPVVLWCLLCSVISLPALLFLGSIDGDFPVRFLPIYLGFSEWLERAAAFAAVELGPFLLACVALLIWRGKRHGISASPLIGTAAFCLSVAVLAFSLCIQTGRFNDFAMRVSMPALLFLSLFVADAFVQAVSDKMTYNRRFARFVLIFSLGFMLAVQSGAALHEGYRALAHYRWQPQLVRQVSRIEDLRPEFFLTERLGVIRPRLCAILFRCPARPDLPD